MKPVIPFITPKDELEAIQIQQELAPLVEREDRFDSIGRIAGVDVAYDKQERRAVAAVVVCDAQSLQILETVTADDDVAFPYVPGLFSFRELPALVRAMEKLEIQPDLVICDGQGIAHPRRCGLASHLGILFDVPTIGCGKSRLLGDVTEPGDERGSWTPIIDRDEVIGCLLRTQTGIKPVYVSIGHRVSLSTACSWTLAVSTMFRLPETTRMADQAVRAVWLDGAIGKVDFAVRDR